MDKAGFQLKVGSVFETSGVKHFVSQINHSVNQVVLTSAQSEFPVITTIDRLYDGVKRGEVLALNLRGETADASLQVSHDDTLSDLSKREYALRKNVVEFVNKTIDKGCPVTVAYQLAATEFSKPTEHHTRAYSARTVRRWYETSQKNGFKSLVPKHNKKGRTKSFMSEQAEQLIAQVVYENRHVARLTIRNISNKVQYELHKQSLLNDKVSYAKVRDVVTHMPWTLRHVEKFEPKLRRAIASFGVESYQVQYPLQRVEMDCCKLPFFALYKKGGKPVEVWAVVAIDVATGHILAAHLITRPPNSMDALIAVQKASHGLTEDDFVSAQIQNRFKVTGNIEEIVVDNGSEFRSESFSNVTKLGIKVTYCPAYSPYRKPFVERAVGALKSFVGNLPGSTVNRADTNKPDTDRGAREAVICIQELQQMVNGFIFDDYALRQLKRHELVTLLLNDRYGLTPSQRMINLLSEFTPSPPFSEDSFRLARMNRSSATLQKYGIRHENLEYSSSELKALFEHIGISTKSLVVPDKLEFLHDPMDIRSILVTNPLTGKKIAAHIKYKLDVGMTLEHFQEAKAYANEVFKSDDGKAIMQAFKIRILQISEELEKEAASASKRKGKRKDASAMEKARTAAAQPPLSEKDVSSDQLALAEPVGSVKPLDFSGVTPAARIKRGAK
jgi:putative transposase